VISEGPTLIEALPGSLQQALDRTVQPDEKLRISVRGITREALAATDRRVLVLQEPPGGGEAAVEIIPLAEVRRARLASATGGGTLTIERNGGEPVQVSVPIYDQVKYGRVAERLQQMAGAAIRTAEPGARTSCPKCQAAIPPEGIFCPACRLQVADVCAQCTRTLEAGWQYCPRCGLAATITGLVNCPSCGEAVWPTQPFCSGCGSALHDRCARCGGFLMAGWKHCATCGQPADESAPPQARAAAPAARQVAPNAAAEELNAAGIAAYGNDQIDEAISLFQRAIVRSPEVASYHTNLAVAYGEKGMDLEAYAAYRRALDSDPNQLQARLNIGYLYSERERYEQAREEWERVVASAPDSEEAQEARDNLNHLEEL
jgi:tetratricopeptide (TPR) repeat protein